MPSVAWFYPERPRQEPARAAASAVLPEIAQRRYRYSIEGGQAALASGQRLRRWAQGLCRVLARHRSGEMPPLFVVGADGKLELVNSRANGNVLIVDRLFAAAELRLGGESQQIVRIVRTDGRQQR